VESSKSRAGPFAEAGAGVGDLLDHLVCAGEQRWRHLDAERLGGLQVYHELEFGRPLDGRSAGLTPLRMLPV
jgi:hypothetical protein